MDFQANFSLILTFFQIDSSYSLIHQHQQALSAREEKEAKHAAYLYSIDIFLTYLIIYENFLNTKNNDNKMSERRMEKEEEKLSFE